MDISYWLESTFKHDKAQSNIKLNKITRRDKGSKSITLK